MFDNHAFQIVAFADAPLAPNETAPLDDDPQDHIPLCRSGRTSTVDGKTTRTMTRQLPLSQS